MKQKVLVTGIVPRAGLDALYTHFDVTYTDGTPFTRQEVLAFLPEMDGMLMALQTADKELLDAAKRLKSLSVFGVGFDNVDIAYAKEKGILVCNAPMAVMEPTAEMTMALMLAVTRRICDYDRNLKQGVWQNCSLPEGSGFSLYRSTLGIVGMGRIGRAVARRAMAFGMRILYHEQMELPEEALSGIEAERVDFDTLLAASDVVSIHAPLLASTHHLFNTETFKKMKNTAYLINAARGPIVEEAALIRALEEGEIAGAGLDVFEFEPKIAEGLLKLPNVVLSPHAGTGCLSSRTILAEEAAENLIACLVRNAPVNVVNR